MKMNFGKASRLAMAIAHARPSSIPVEPLAHWRACGAFRVEATWTVDVDGGRPVAIVGLAGDAKAIAVDVKTDGPLTVAAARELARLLSAAIAAASNLERIIKEI